MKRFKSHSHYKYFLMLIALLGFVGCEKRGADESVNENGYTMSDTSTAPEAGTTLEERVRGATIDPPPVTMARVHYLQVQFADNSVELTEDSEKDLKELSEKLDKSKPAYLTVRVQDLDNIDATEPKRSFEKFTPERVEEIEERLTRDGVILAEVAVDEAGKVENYGEGNVMARPEGDVSSDKYQYIVVAFEEARDKRAEKIESNL